MSTMKGIEIKENPKPGKLSQLQVWKTVLYYMRPWPMYWFWMFIRFLYIILEILSPIFLGKFVDELSKQNYTGQSTYFWLGLTVGALVIGPGIEVYTSRKAWVIAGQVSRSFRFDIIQNFRYIPLDFWSQNSKGKILKAINSSTESMNQIVANISFSYLWIFGRIFGVILGVVYLNIWATAVLVLNFGMYALTLFFISKRDLINTNHEQKAEEIVSGSINQFLTNFKTIVYLNLFDNQENELKELNQKSFQAYLKRENTNMSGWYLINTISGISLASILVIGLWQIRLGGLSVGGLSSILLFLNTYSSSLGWLYSSITQYNKHIVKIDRYLSIFKVTQNSQKNISKKANLDIQALDEKNQKIETPKLSSFKKLEIKNLSLSRDNRKSVDNINLKIKMGQKVALVGYTGSGKSSLLDLILKVEQPSTGKIIINDIDYRYLQTLDLVSIFSIVPQSVQLFGQSISQNIQIQKNLDSNSLNKIIKICQLQDLIKKLPEGLKTNIQESGYNFSGGEKQRIGVARALAQNQDILVLDEATASLDPKTERKLIESIIQNYDKTLFFITHKYSLLNHFDIIYVMNEGRIVQSGSFSELSQKPGLFKDLYQASKI